MLNMIKLMMIMDAAAATATAAGATDDDELIPQFGLAQSVHPT